MTSPMMAARSSRPPTNSVRLAMMSMTSPGMKRTDSVSPRPLASCRPARLDGAPAAREEALQRRLQRSSRSVAVTHSVMSKAAESQVGRLRATALGDRHQVVDLQQMGRGAAPPAERVAITAATAVAMPDVAPDSGGNVAPPRGLVAAVNRFAGHARRRSGCYIGRSAAREHAEHGLRRRSGDRRARHGGAGMAAIRQGAGRELRRRNSRGRAR